MTIDDEMLMAYADGELDPLRARRVEAAVAADPELADRIAAHRALKSRLSSHYAPVAKEAVPDRLRALFPGDNVVAFERPTAPPRPSRWAQAAAIAATLVIGVVIGSNFDGGSPVASVDGAIVARADLAKALDTRLASAAAGDSVRIGLTFRNRDGAICRSFSDAALSGVACRSGERWSVRQMSSGDGQKGTDYRQASSADAATLAAIEGMIDGAPFDAAAEQQALAGGWR